MNNQTRQFVIFTLPRSRSAWLAQFLSYGLFSCGHDLSAYCGSVEEWLGRFSALTGSVETGAVVGWRVLQSRLPHAKILVVRRPLREVFDSFHRLRVEFDAEELFRRAIALDTVASMTGVEVIEYRELEEEEVCARLFEHTLGIAHVHNWWAALAKQNVQINIHERVQLLQSRQQQLGAFRAEVEQLSMAMTPKGLN